LKLFLAVFLQEQGVPLILSYDISTNFKPLQPAA
jgi:hypothetical protein